MNEAKRKYRYEVDKEKTEFNIPEQVQIELGVTKLSDADLPYIKYTTELQTFLDLTLVSAIIYAITEIYFGFFEYSKNELNLSIFWCAMIIAYGLGILTSITKEYLKTEEASLCVLFACVSFLLSMLIQFADMNLFEFNLNESYLKFSSNARLYINRQISMIRNSTSIDNLVNIEVVLVDQATNKHETLLFSCFMATLSAYLGTLLFYPSFRLAKIYLLNLKYCANMTGKKFLLVVNFMLPFFISITFVKVGSTVSASTWATMLKSTHMQFALVALFACLRLALFKSHAQAYLNLAYEEICYLRKHTARRNKITNLQYQSKILSIFKYYGVCASQYLVPVYVLVFLMLIYKTLGGLNWCSLSACKLLVDRFFVHTTHDPTSNTKSGIFKRLDSLTDTDLPANLFPFAFVQSFFGFFIFWICTIWFLCSCFGILYYQYVDRSLVNPNDETKEDMPCESAKTK
jgi:hypothetical protein